MSPVNTANLGGGGTSFVGGMSILTEAGSAVSGYGPILGADVLVVALTVPSILDSSSVDTTFALSGAAVGDTVLLAPPSAISSGVHAFAWVPSAGNVSISFVASKGTAAQTAQTWGVSVLKRVVVPRI